jgi:uncharacterized protein YcbK (DUF882 family)
MKLYPMGSYFTTHEFKCPCDCGFGSEEKHIDPDLIEKLNMVRMIYGKPMVVTSGARCEDYNRQVGGVEDSAHLPHPATRQCRAVDILVEDSMDRHDLIDLALKIGFVRMGLASNFLHFDVAWDLPNPVVFNY